MANVLQAVARGDLVTLGIRLSHSETAYAVMERAANRSVAPFAAGWSGLDDWGTVWRESGPVETSLALMKGLGRNGVVTSAHATAIDRTETLLRADGDRLEVVGIGLSNISRGDKRCHAGRRPEPRP